tara:strand:+ start:4502 stop:6874 length:2373 start_codon:yes stop_codon:yes gene_type:complete
MSKRRLQVKDFESAVGTYTPRTQAQVGTFAYVPPSKPSGQSDLEQLSKAFETLGDASLSWALGRMDQENREDLKRGVSAASLNRLDLLKKIKGGIDAAVKRGDLKRNESPITKQGYLATLGELFARSGSTKDFLTEGMEGAANRYWNSHFNPEANQESPEDVDPASALANIRKFETFEQFTEAILSERVKKLTKQVGDNRYTRDAGFAPAIKTVLEQVNTEWVRTGKEVFARENRSALAASIQERFDTKSPQEVVNWFATGTFTGKPEEADDPDDPAASDWKAASVPLPRNSVDAPRFFFYEQVEAHINSKLLDPSNTNYVTDIIQQLNFLRTVKNSKEPSSGRKVGEGELTSKYNQLEFDLNGRLQSALQKNKQTAAANMTAAVKQLGELFSTHYIETKGNSKPATTNDVVSFLTALREGRLTLNGNPITTEDIPPRILSNIDAYTVSAILRGQASGLRARRTEDRTKKGAQREAAEAEYTEYQNMLIDLYRNAVEARIKKNGTFLKGKGLEEKREEMLDMLIVTQETLFPEIATEHNEFIKKLLGVEDSPEFKSYAEEPSHSQVESIYRALDAGLLDNKSELQLERYFHTNNWTSTQAKEVLATLKEEGAAFLKLMHLNQTKQLQFTRLLFNSLGGFSGTQLTVNPAFRNSILDQQILGRMEEGVRNSLTRDPWSGMGLQPLHPSIIPFIMGKELIIEFMNEVYPSAVKKIFDTVGRDSAEKVVKLSLTQEKGPLMWTLPSGEKVQISETTLLQDLSEWPTSKQNKDGDNYEGWDDFFKARLEAKQLD